MRVKKSGVVMLCGESAVLSAESEIKAREVKVGTRDCASMAGEFEPCCAPDCEDVLCFGVVGPVLRDDWAVVGEDAVSVTDREAEKTGVRSGLNEAGDGELGEAHFEIAAGV